MRSRITTTSYVVSGLHDSTMHSALNTCYQLSPLPRDLLSSLERRMDIVERAAFKSSNRNTSTPSHSSRVHFKPPASSETMKLSDLDISPIKSGQFERGSVKESGRNPLYRSPRSLDSYLKQEGSGPSLSASGDSYQGAGEREEGEEEEEGSDLDGHTLSCSLELMSDLEGGSKPHV